MAKFKKPGKSFRVSKPNYNKNYVCIKQLCLDEGDEGIGSADLEVYLKLDEASGLDKQDSTVNNRDGVETNGTTAAMTGIIGDASNFDPNSTKLVLSSSNTLTDTGDYSISCWVMFDTLTTHRSISAKNGAFTLWYFQDNDLIRFTNIDATPTNFVEHSLDPLVDTWYNVVVTVSRANSRMRIYIDTVVVEETGTMGSHTSADIAVGSHELNLGANQARNMDGLVDEYFIYSRELTAEEVAFIYNAGVGRTYEEIVA